MKPILLLLFLTTILLACKRDPNDRTCPACNKTDMVVPIVYGMPTKETMDEAEAGHIMLGGCEVTGNDPGWYCKRDGEKF